MLLTENLIKKFNDIGLETHYFKIGWYNDDVDDRYKLDYPYDTLAIVILSNPSWFEKGFLPYLAINNKIIVDDNNDDNDCLSKNCYDPIDQCMKYYFDLLSKEIINELNDEIKDLQIDKFHDFELFNRRPRILLQTAAHISGAAYYYRINKSNDGNNKNKLGVCIHPEYGGWFGLRGVFIFKNFLVPQLSKKLPKNIVADMEKQKLLLKLFNENWNDGTYRDIIPVKKRYSDIQFKYFQLEPRKRFQYLRNEIFPKLNELIQK